MGEQWKPRHNEIQNPRLKETGGLDHVELAREMPIVEKTALQAALAIHAFLTRHRQSMDSVDFVHPWANKEINRNVVMREWAISDKGKTDAEKLGDFLESMDPDAHEVVDITEKEKREALLSRMNVDLTPLPDIGATLH